MDNEYTRARGEENGASTVLTLEPPSPPGIETVGSRKGGAAATATSNMTDVSKLPGAADAVDNDDVALPLDPLLDHGVLENGCEYFVRPCSKPAQSCELRLVVRVGSLCEEEHERGLAHFLEHMGFKGTKVLLAIHNIRIYYVSQLTTNMNFINFFM
mmetsp:Transcript_16940/g.39627  ORF Transcript_16940/g.39627 Transcript_16940/m.39627 type:complete len:157 (-) Transcript_16940:3724-4194(-)